MELPIRNGLEPERGIPMVRRKSKSKSISPWLIVGIIFGVIGFIIAGCAGLGWWAFSSLTKPTSYPAETEPYHLARARFQTTLVSRGPSPQPYDRLLRPPGVNELPYRSGNLDLKAWVSAAPADGSRKPAVVFLHGGFAFGDDDWDETQAFLQAGFITMMPMLRGENGQSGEYSMFYNEVDDVLAATAALARLPYVDRSKIYLCGHSVGGTITMLTAMTSDQFRAAASFSGSTDQKLWSRGQEELCPFNIRNAEEYRMRSPLAFAKSFRCPLRIYYGSTEFLFSGMSQETAKRAKAAGLDVEATSIPGDHSTALAPSIDRAIAFFKSK